MKLSKKSKLKTAEVLFLFEAMVIAIKLITSIDYEKRMQYYALLDYLALGGSHFIKAVRTKNKDKDKYTFIKYIALFAMFFLSAVVIYVVPLKPAVRIMIITYGVSLLFARVIAIIYKRKVAHTLWNVIVFLIAALLPLTAMSDERDDLVTGIIVTFFLIAIQTLVRLIGIAMSQIRLDILKRIFIKSMASEVFLGLMILIVSFSMVFDAIGEPAIESFGDGLWYCFALVTTIGFGDITAVTVAGRILSVILGIYGIIVVALITSIIINFYNETKDVVMTDEGDDEDEEILPPDENETLPTEETEEVTNT